MNALRILITGSRDWSDRDVIRQALMSISAVHGVHARDVTVVHGAARGADTIAAEEAAKLGMQVEAHPADWDSCQDACRWGHRRMRNGRSYCPAAGNYRNQEMVNLGADVVLAFPLGRSIGTQDCMRRARRASIAVIDLGPREAA